MQELELQDKVLYVPTHAEGDITHPDCERGVITAMRDGGVWVRFGNDAHAKLCYPENLVRLTE